MAWIESHQTLARHPKTGRLLRALGISRVEAIGHLQFFWWWALDYAQDGDISSFGNSEIAEACQWIGDPDTFIHALISSGFVDQENAEKRIIHDHSDYCGKLISQRKANANRQKTWRDKRKTVTLQLPNNNVTVTLPLRNGATVKDSKVKDSKVKDIAPSAEIKPENAIPPTPEAVAGYFKAKGSTGAEGKLFFLHYESNGWMVGKNRMRSWRAAAAGWIERGPGFRNGGSAPEIVTVPMESEGLRQARLKGSPV